VAVAHSISRRVQRGIAEQQALFGRRARSHRGEEVFSRGPAASWLLRGLSEGIPVMRVAGRPELAVPLPAGIDAARTA
jgi:hypothetical protein